MTIFVSNHIPVQSGSVGLFYTQSTWHIAWLGGCYSCIDILIPLSQFTQCTSNACPLNQNSAITTCCTLQRPHEGGRDHRFVLLSGQQAWGALRYHMDTHCQTAVQSGSGEHQNVGALSSFQVKKGDGQLHTTNIIGADTYKL